MAVNKINYDRAVDKKMSRLSISIIVTTFAISLAIIGLFCFGPYDAELEGPEYTEAMLNWAYILLGITVVLTVLFPIIGFARQPKQGIKNIIPLLGLVAVAAICYYVAEGTVLDLPGYNGTDNNPETLKWSEATLYLTYVLMILNIVALFATEIYKKLKK